MRTTINFRRSHAQLLLGRFIHALHRRLPFPGLDPRRAGYGSRATLAIHHLEVSTRGPLMVLAPPGPNVLNGSRRRLRHTSSAFPVSYRDPRRSAFSRSAAASSGCYIGPPIRHRDASSSECPRHHKRELFSPECATVRPSSLIHDDIRVCVAQRVCPSPCIL